MYTAYVLTEEAREVLLEKYPQKYGTFKGEHITVEFGVSNDTPLPAPASIRVVGEADSGDGLQALVVSVGGTMERPDGKTYHVTWSLDAEMYKPVDSNALIADYSRRWTVSLPIDIDAEPALLK